MSASQSAGIGILDGTLDTSQVPVDALEPLRLRLSHLTHWLSRLQAHVQQQALPSWPSIHSQFAMILKQLNFLTHTLETHAETLRTTNAYPLPTFPVAKQPGLLPTLLRKRNEPEVDEWIEKGRKEAEETGSSARADDEVWKDAYLLLVALQHRRTEEVLGLEDGKGAGEQGGGGGIDVHEPVRKVAMSTRVPVARRM
ncbi:mediator of RNA polymerase II transcription complex subunit 8-domain-containing protein [Myxozyma melibiosi]|uniref:Mediator of RNA polymerase II transcription subunit 8 n=1 Tax=Myxozyma melibiosi TaxID=54550 RepID=A0ABR1FAX6_9ASCO